jgi:hypothetical protein
MAVQRFVIWIAEPKLKNSFKPQQRDGSFRYNCLANVIGAKQSMFT